MSTTHTFIANDFRPWNTMSDKQKANAVKYNLRTKYSDLPKSNQEQIIKTYEGEEMPDGAKFTKDILKAEDYVKVFQWTVKTDFLEKCPNPETKQTEELFNTFNIAGFVHNETGPALINMVADREEFYMNGKEVDAEMAKKMQHNNQFITKLDKLMTQSDDSVAAD